MLQPLPMNIISRVLSFDFILLDSQARLPRHQRLSCFFISYISSSFNHASLVLWIKSEFNQWHCLFPTTAFILSPPSLTLHSSPNFLLCLCLTSCPTHKSELMQASVSLYNFPQNPFYGSVSERRMQRLSNTKPWPQQQLFLHPLIFFISYLSGQS